MLVENVLKKMALFHAEMVSFGADKVKEVADDFVKKGMLHDEDAKKFVAEVREKLQSKRNEWEGKAEKVNALTKEILNEFGFSLKGDSEKLDTKITDLEKQLDELKARKEAMKKEMKKDAKGKKEESIA